MSGDQWMFRTDHIGDVHRPNAQCAIFCKPVVVISPEDREQVERLMDLFDNSWSGCGGSRDAVMQAALREFANPTPPKPDEPKGLGAVVEDADGACWVRHEADVASGPSRAWYPAGYVNDRKRTYWSDIEAVRILSEGVQS